MRRVSKPDPVLFTPVRLGAFNLAHRVVMAAAAPCVATVGNFRWPAVTAYYRERATFGGLLISEATHVLADLHTDAGCPGIYTAAQVNGWREMTNAVHRQGGIVLVHLTVPALKLVQGASLDRIIQGFRSAAENAGDAGFDGVEISAGAGTLPGALLRGECKTEPDYSGSLENRLRLLSEVLETVCGVCESDHVGLWLAPLRAADLAPALALLEEQSLAYLHLPACPLDEPDAGITSPDWQSVRGACRSTALVVSEVSLEALPTGAMQAGAVDAISQSNLFISNPDLPRRLLQGLPLQAAEAIP